MRPANDKFFIRIDHAEQVKRRELIPNTGIIMADTYLDLKYNLQAAPIIAIGKDAKEFFPEAEIGDILIFHHIVEHEDGGRTIDKNDDYSILYVNANSEDIFGIQKIDTLEIIPCREWIWTSIKQDQTISAIENGSLVSVNLYQFEGYIRSEIERKQEDIKNWSDSMITPMIKEKIRQTQMEMGELNKELNKARAKECIIDYIHPETSKLMGMKKGDTAIFTGYIGFDGYPLSVQDIEKTPDGELVTAGSKKSYFLHKYDFIIAKKK